MANAQFFQFRYSKERMMIDLYCKVAIGSTGAPTLVTGSRKGIASIVRNSAGNYTVTLSDVYNRILGANFNFVASAGPAAPLVSVVSETVSGSKTVIIQCADIAGDATDPASGEVMLINLALANVP